VLNISCGGFSERSQDFSTTSISWISQQVNGDR
jgi:hypothetical protein